MLHYYAERMFSPVMLSPVKTNQTHFQVHIVSNKRFQMSNATVDVSVQRYDSLLNQSPPKVYKETLYIGIIWPRGSRQYYEGDYYDLLRRGECFDEYGLVDEAYCFLTFRLQDVLGSTLSQNELLSPPKAAKGVQYASIKVDSVEADCAIFCQEQETNWISCQKSCSELIAEDKPSYQSVFLISLSTDNVALFVWLEAIGINGRFEENGFLMSARKKSLKFFSKDSGVTASQLQSSLRLSAVNQNWK